eukprot:CAMPEP_0194490014 /NCGR_PEP_ID=MMETSP0253-20130528/9377_1 /TAXON_ID=2966 /ORGANISM="Noctiluca scintillans" /LENGTH=117 /DNA_ID=CAMNT_0039330589 /DNA_START=49 /DNA_END=402 /DNA_ORIENTATION=-
MSLRAPIGSVTRAIRRTVKPSNFSFQRAAPPVSAVVAHATPSAPVPSTGKVVDPRLPWGVKWAGHADLEGGNFFDVNALVKALRVWLYIPNFLVELTRTPITLARVMLSASLQSKLK